MNNERTIVLENIGDQPVGLKDTQNRTYRLGVGGKIRISSASLQDILDYPASKIIFSEGLVGVRNVSANTLYDMGLTEEEIYKFSLDDAKAVVITETIEEKPYDEVIEEDEVIIPVEESAKPKTTTIKKPAAKKAPAKKASSTKTK